MKCIRKILRVSWTQKKANEWVLQAAGMEQELLTIKRRKFGHVMRTKGYCLDKEIMQGTTPGARKQGKPRMRWMDNMEQWTGMVSGQFGAGQFGAANSAQTIRRKI